MTLQVGLVGEVVRRVDDSMTASAVGSGGLEVLSTPWMITLMEIASREAVEHLLPAGQLTVGVRVDVRHLAATPTGMEVRARAELVEVDGRRLVFRVEAHDARDKVGEGIHERAVVNLQRLLERTRAKRH